MMLVILLNICYAQINSQLYKWGTYKPQLIHGITERNTQTFNALTVTFYYFLNNQVSWEKSIKYRINDMENELYSYIQHDGERSAVHQIIDKEYKLHITNEFYKINPEKVEDWVTTAINNESYGGDDEYVSLVYSIALEKLNNEKADLRRLKVEEEGDSLKISVTSAQAVNFIYISLISDNQKIRLIGNPNFGHSVQSQSPQLNYNLRGMLFKLLKQSNMNETTIPYKLTDKGESDTGNIVFVQYVAKRKEFFKFQLRYMQKELSISSDSFFEHKVIKKLDNLQFMTHYNRTFQPQQKDLNPFFQYCARQSLVNLLGGYVISYGNIECEEVEPQCLQNKMMLTPTPSRFGFPRPFLWDDGFHNMLACRWKPALCLQTLIDWFDTMSPSGWIPREQARTPEQKAAVPNGFLAQKKSETNPPTFIFNILFLDKLAEKNAEISKQIRGLWPKMMQWYHFWINSQGVTEESETHLFKWWGKNEQSNFGSGMDDWPRQVNGVKSKYNIDASMWAWLFSEGMQRLSAVYDPQQKEFLKQQTESIRKAIMKSHFDSDRIFKDLMADDSFSPHLGYPNLLPIAFGFIDERDTQTLDAYATMIKDELWTKFGLRSLSQNDNHFGKGDNYWTGPIWIPINYLVLRGIYRNYRNHQGLWELYNELRENLMNNVCINWREKGYFYEHYNQKQDGLGSGYHPFNGWTSTITLIINEIYD